jgi:hypothetical protein
MSTATKQTATRSQVRQRTGPSHVRSSHSSLFADRQELKVFGSWVGESMWVPPKDASAELAKSMLRRFGLLSSKSDCWSGILDEHRSKFQQVREIDLCRASIRLPKGKLFVSVTEQDQFDKITDTIPSCVQTRLDEFLAGPGKKKGVKVYYLKPLCVELGDELLFTSRENVITAITQIQAEVFASYRRMYLTHRPLKAIADAAIAGLSIPGKIYHHFAERRRQAINAYEARLEFRRRQIALRAAETHRKFRTDGCTFEEMLALTNPLERNDVIEQYCIERQLSRAEREKVLRLAAESVPWFVALSLGISYATSTALSISVLLAPPLMVCDPAFVAELPDAPGVLLKIGHFDEVDGVTHIEI